MLQADFKRPPTHRVRSGLMAAAAIAALGFGVVESKIFVPTTAGAETSPVSAGPASFADVVDRVKGAVVSVKVKVAREDAVADDRHIPRFAPGTPLDRFFKQFGLPAPDEEDEGDAQPQHRANPHPRQSMAQGSGYFISADGYIVTNNHVIDHATEVTVTTVDGKAYTAKVIGADPKTDVALLKVKEAVTFPYVEFATVAPRVGDWVLAVGNPFGLGGTVTAGIVSARGRDIGNGPYDDFLQIDAPVNHGNSGGPTFNNQGLVVGMNTAIFSPSGGSVGIGFAISGDVVKTVVQQLKDSGTVTRGWLGIEIQPVTQELADSFGVKKAEGALIAKIQNDSPAAGAGLKPGDIVIAVDGASVADPKELSRRIAGLGPKKTVDLTVLRDGASKNVQATLGKMPGEVVASREAPADVEDTASLAKLGLKLHAGRGAQKGVVVGEVDADGLAAQRGLAVGDLILDAAGKPVTAPGDVTKAFDSAKSEGRKTVLLRVKTGEQMRFVALPTQAGL